MKLKKIQNSNELEKIAASAVKTALESDIGISTMRFLQSELNKIIDKQIYKLSNRKKKNDNTNRTKYNY